MRRSSRTIAFGNERRRGGRDGWTVAKDFRAVFPHAPVVFATGYVPRYQTFPHSILLNKPYRPAQVLQALTKLAA